MKQLLLLLVFILGAAAGAGQGVGQGFTPTIGIESIADSLSQERLAREQAISNNSVSDQAYADLVRKRSRISASGSPNLAYQIGVDTFERPQIWYVGDSKFNAVHTSSKMQADYGHCFGFPGVGYLSLSTFNNGRLGLIPRATNSTRVEYPENQLAKYSLDGHAQKLTGAGELRIEPNPNYTTYTDDEECQYWNYARISYLRHPGGGNIRILVDDVELVILDANGAEEKQTYEITSLSDSIHVLTIQNVTGINYTLDGYFVRTTVAAPVINFVANSGYDAAQWNTLLNEDNKTHLAAYPPTSVAVRSGANDSSRDFTPTQFATNVMRIVDTFLNYSNNADVALIGMEGMGLGSIYSDSDYNNELKDTAVARNALYFSLSEVVPDMEDFQARGFSNDAVHENDKGSHLIGGYIVYKMLRSDGVSQGSAGANATPTLQEVTDAGAMTSNDLTVGGRFYLNDGNTNVLIGTDVGRVRTTFGSSVIAGYQAGYNQTSGNSNSLFGYQAAYRLTTGTKNNVFGVQSFFNNRTGSENLAIGSQAGSIDVNSNAVFTADNCIFLGPRSKPKADNTINEIVVGYDAEGNGPNSVTIGGPDIDSCFLQGDVHATNVYLDEDIHARVSYAGGYIAQAASLPYLLLEETSGNDVGAMLRLRTQLQEYRFTNTYHSTTGSGSCVLHDRTAGNNVFEVDAGSSGQFNIYREVNMRGEKVVNADDATTPNGLTTKQQMEAAIAALVRSGSGSPEGSVTAPPGTLYLNTSGGANTTLYVKESGTGNTGWVAK